MIVASPLLPAGTRPASRQEHASASGQDAWRASEIMTMLMHFHQSHDRDCKAFYSQYVLPHWRADVSSAGQLHPLRATAPFGAGAPVCLSGDVSRAVQQPLLCRLDQTGRLPQSPHQAAARLCRAGERVARMRWTGSTASRCIWWSMTAARPGRPPDPSQRR